MEILKKPILKLPLFILLLVCHLNASAWTEPNFRVLYEKAGFWKIGSINQQFDWANDQKEPEIRKFWLEAFWMYRVPEKLGGINEGWEDSPHFNYVRSCSIALIEIYHSEGNDRKALELYLWMKELGMVQDDVGDQEIYIPQKYQNTQFWKFPNIQQRFNWIQTVESKIDRVFWLEQILFHYLPPEYGERTLWRANGFEDDTHFNFVQLTGDELKKLRFELEIFGNEKFEMYP